MSENLPKKYKESFFSRCINKLKSLFKKKKIKNVDFNIETFENKDSSNDLMINRIKVDVNTRVNPEYEKREFMNNLTNNPELLENFSNDRLEKILQYYLEDNEKKRELLKKIS